jgi:AcrR family transcriptional regulator
LVFSYFASKEALLAAVIEDRLNTALRFWDDLPPLTGSALLLEIAERALARAIQHPQEFRLYFALFFQPGAPDAVRAASAQLLPQVKAYYAVLARALRQAGSKQPAVDAMLFQAGLNGLVQNLVIQPDLAENDTLFPRRRLITRLVQAFTTIPATRAPRRHRK